ncbi:FAD-binding protein [Streptomyces lunaelactis]|uniref:FAD-binding protein n=1 Tax=Streptomyces lunaelactis TaxID=1535768 RepID=A0A2R4SZF9_9ACTN|nr:FAD-binding oxidoreductase [Streptomyces lunaelactis]AVZ72231.1 FAD-binding protein [Streptomyces lunaelactis]NUK88638.1 FAD-binding oxidoreductase [Streptomyces lunaelactis]NUL05445.1 FAD-binding oxidoreductase [Streptomyces lunaelactis]
MAPQGMTEAALTGFRQQLTGDALTSGDPGYDEARAVHNAMIDRRPAVIAQCETEADVARSIRFGRENDLEIAVRGGGHSVAGMSLSDGGIVVDLRRMHTVIINPESRAARVGGGATMSHLDRATQPYDLATTGGRASTTGVGGFTLGGGSGWLERKFGLACDNLLAVELVTADGSTVHASEDENQELFWALHGGGGNFGVATAITLKLHELPAMSMIMLLFRPDSGPEVLRAYRDFVESAPDEVGGGCIYLTGPPEEFVPEDLVGKLVCAVLITYAGTESEARMVAAPMLELAHAAEMIAELPYAELQCMLDDPAGMRNYWSAEYLDALPDKAVDAFCARSSTMIVPSGTQHVLFPLGGAAADGPAHYPLPWRGSPWVVHPFGTWESPADDERGKKWVRDVRADVQPWSNGAVYLNFIGQEGDERVVAGVGGDNYARLAAVKAQYDPDNVFRLNHNIKPA